MTMRYLGRYPTSTSTRQNHERIHYKIRSVIPSMDRYPWIRVPGLLAMLDRETRDHVPGYNNPGPLEAWFPRESSLGH